MTEQKQPVSERGGNANRPAIGIVAVEDSDAVAGTLLRVLDHGHQPFLVTDGTPEEAVAFADLLGVETVPIANEQTGGGRYRTLKELARERGYPGVICHEDPTQPIDIPNSVKRLHESDAYIVESVHSSKIDGEPTVLAAIPAHNEADTIGDMVTEANQLADEVVVIDDGSDDTTAEMARNAGATVIQHDHNRGYGAALQAAFQEAERSGADHLVILDGDGQHDPSDIERLVETQQMTDAELVVGCRFGEDTETNLPTYRHLGLKVVNSLTNLSLGRVRPSSWIKDTQSGFRAYDRTAIESLAAADGISDNMGASTDILQHASQKGYTVAEVGTTINYDGEENSNHHPLSHGLQLIHNILVTIERKRPILMLGVPGTVSILIGIGFAYWAISVYLTWQTFPVGLALTSVFFTLVGVFASFTAIILHSLKQHTDSMDAADSL